MAAPTKSDPHSNSWNARYVQDILNSSTEMIRLSSPKTRYSVDPVMIHKQLLCFFSSYYRAALDGSFSEAGSDSLEMDVDISIVHAFQGWLYTGKLLCDDDVYLLIYLYIFADAKDILALRRDTISLIIDYVGCKAPRWHHVSQFCHELPASSPLFRFYVHLEANHWNETFHEDGDGQKIDVYKELSMEYTYSVTMEVRRKAANIELLKDGDEEEEEDGDESYDGYEAPCPCHKNPCDYHEHEDRNEWQKSCGHANSNAKPPTNYTNKPTNR